jgi:hypothetical protein
VSHADTNCNTASNTDAYADLDADSDGYRHP